jgi:hypothetical protein
VVAPRPADPRLPASKPEFGLPSYSGGSVEEGNKRESLRCTRSSQGVPGRFFPSGCRGNAVLATQWITSRRNRRRRPPGTLLMRSRVMTGSSSCGVSLRSLARAMAVDAASFDCLRRRDEFSWAPLDAAHRWPRFLLPEAVARPGIEAGGARGPGAQVAARQAHPRTSGGNESTGSSSQSCARPVLDDVRGATVASRYSTGRAPHRTAPRELS